MPKENIDYSNTIIYKVFCKDENIKDIYVGHTTNFIKRKYQHKICSTNLSNKLKIYDIIRKNGGWDNWDMIEIAKYCCKDSAEARIKEQEHFDLLKPSLNIINLSLDATSFCCEYCDYYTDKKYNWDRHILTSLHKNNKNTKLNKDNSSKYYCEHCDFETNEKFNWDRHISTTKHLKRIKDKNQDQISDKDQSIDKELLMFLIKENSEFKNLMMEVIKNGTMNNSHNHTNNSHNKSFNLNFFLNETCKNAMNIMDFVDSIKLQLSDLENVGEVGYVKGISNIIVKNLKQLDVTERPIHCTDSKREVVYVKDDNKWEKDTENKNMLKKLIKKVSKKNISLIPEFKAKYPDCIYSNSKKSDQYNKIIVEAY